MKKFLVISGLFLCALCARAQDKTVLSADKFILFPGNDITIPPGGTVTVRIREWLDNVDAPKEALITGAQWTIAGNDYATQNMQEGNLKLETLQFTIANYTAPSKVPPHNPVVITVSFQPEGQKTKIILYCQIYVVDKENYFYLGNSKGGQLYEVKEPLLASLRTSQDRADYVNDQWNIMVNGMRKMNDSNSTMQPMSMLITVTQSNTGTYKWTIYGNCSKGLTPPCNTAQVMGSGSDGSPFQYGSFDCTGCESENCKLIATEGSTTISVFDKKNKIIKGYFSGTLVSPNHQSVHVSGAFSVSIQ